MSSERYGGEDPRALITERTLTDKVAAEAEEVGTYSAVLLLAEVVEDLVRRVAELERFVRPPRGAKTT